MTQLSLRQQVHQLRNLEAAWKAIQENGRSSKSEVVREEIASFDEDAWGNLRSLAGRLVKGSFSFPPARGVKLLKANKKDWRPIVLASVQSRIVQRAILQVLQRVEALEPYFRNPYSFGGIRRKRGQGDAKVKAKHRSDKAGAEATPRQSRPEDLAAVPGAILAVLEAISNGGRYIVCADITSFFTRISKSAVSDVIGSVVPDLEFMMLFREAIKVELSNAVELRSHAKRFPTEDMGVAQGNSLSPLLGNIILHEFDRDMNDGDCRCFRYIDDFIIVAPTKKAAMARLKKARRILGHIGMSLSIDKTSAEAIPVTEKFEFLGIEFNNGMIRPASKARTKFLDSLKKTCEDSQRALRGYRSGHALDKSLAVLGTLKRLDGSIHSWGEHYFFCRDEQFFFNLDNEIHDIIRAYLGFYRDERSAVAEEIQRRPMLGVEFLSQLRRQPFPWTWAKSPPPSSMLSGAEIPLDIDALPWEEAAAHSIQGPSSDLAQTFDNLGG